MEGREGGEERERKKERGKEREKRRGLSQRAKEPQRSQVGAALRGLRGFVSILDIIIIIIIILLIMIMIDSDSGSDFDDRFLFSNQDII